MVSDLLLANGGGRNKQLLDKTFTQFEVGEILKLPFSTTGAKDKLYWQFSQSKSYTVQSGYKLARTVSKRDQAESNNKGEVQSKKQMWNNLLGMDIKSKLKHFIWRCYHGSLLVKKTQFDPIWSQCGQVEEDLEHIMFHCERASTVCKLSPVSWEGLSIYSASFREW